MGCNESDARPAAIRYRLLTHPMALVLRTRTLSETRGFMKMLIAADSGRDSRVHCWGWKPAS
ncbi:MAG TPA: hypothetical protein VKF14_04525 [Candidatus Dormibacteraeota bacterium]|nr:hypothetical protein [Candidatus Dormibacteraeota bacterium]